MSSPHLHALSLPHLRVSELIDRVGRVTRGLQFVNGLSPAQWEALRFIARANRYSSNPTALAKFLGSTKGTVSQTLISLEKKGYVQRLR
ncbi:MAG: MarR family transcriptional regulator, partial [Alphaproteobacteria bacterium]